MAQNDVATLQEEFPHATSMFEMWELNGLAQTAVAQRTEELAKAVTTAGQNVAAAVDDHKAAITTAGQNVVAAVGDHKAAMTTAGQNVVAAVGDHQAAMTSASQQMGTAIHDVRDEINNLTMSVGELRTAVSDGAERIAGAIYDLISEGASHGAAEPITRQYEFFTISASKNADDTRRAHLEQLEKTVDEAIRREKLAAFLEHIQRWEDLGSSPNLQRRRRK